MLATIGRSSRIIVVTRWMTKLSSGSGNVCAAGHQNANHVFSSSPQVLQGYQSTVSKTCRALTGPDASLLKSLGNHHSYLKVTHASTASIFLLTGIMPVSNKSLPLPSSTSVYLPNYRLFSRFTSPGKLSDLDRSDHILPFYPKFVIIESTRIPYPLPFILLSVMCHLFNMYERHS